MKSQSISFSLDESSIDKTAGWVLSALETMDVSQSDATRMRLSVEDILLAYLPTSRGEACLLRLLSRGGWIQLRLCVEGPMADPFSMEDEENDESSDAQRYMLNRLGLDTQHRWAKNTNHITIGLPRKRKGLLIKVGVCALAGLAIGFFFRAFFPETGALIVNSATRPLFETFFDVLACFVTPMMFLSIVMGLYNVGDTHQLGRMGKKLLTHYGAVNVLVMCLALGAGLLFFAPPYGGGSGQAQWESLLNLIVDAIPKNILSPFIAGNTLQLLNLGVAIGVAMVFLGDRVKALAGVLGQLNQVMERLVAAVNGLMPALVLMIFFESIVTSDAAQLIQTLGVSLFIIVIEAVVLAAVFFSVSVKLKVKIRTLIKKALPSMATGFTAASSMLAFPSALEASKKVFAVDAKVADFGMPLGFVVFKLSVSIPLVVVGLSCAHLYQVPIDIIGYVLLIVIALILSVATPAIPGGLLSSYMLLFLQFGIPLEAMVLATAVNFIIAFFGAAVTTGTVQMELLRVAGQMGKVNLTALRAEENVQ